MPFKAIARINNHPLCAPREPLTWYEIGDIIPDALAELYDEGRVYVEVSDDDEPIVDADEAEEPEADESADDVGSEYPESGFVDDVSAWILAAQPDADEVGRRLAVAIDEEGKRNKGERTSLVSFFDDVRTELARVGK